MKLDWCNICKGAGEYPHPEAGMQHKCFRCDGLKYLNSQARPFRSERGVQMAKKKFKCRPCDGIGTVDWPDTIRCSFCSKGIIVTEASAGDRLSDEIDKFDFIGKEVWKGLASTMKVAVCYEDRGQTLAEAYLGPIGTANGLWSCTDYGAAFDKPEIFEKFLYNTLTKDSANPQWVKILNPNRVILDTIVFMVNRNGYSVIATEQIEDNTRFVNV